MRGFCYLSITDHRSLKGLQMAVYVDDMRAPFGRMVMCHMMADTDEELHAMADRIGVDRRWWQAPPKASHYDIAISKRSLAIKAGAIAVTITQIGIMNRRRRMTGVFGPPDEAERWYEVESGAKVQQSLF